jgi:hypothetical protein
MEYQALSEKVSALRLQLSKLQHGVGGLLQIQITALQPGSIAERRSTVVFSDVLQSVGGQLGMVHYFLGYYRKAMDTDKMSYPYVNEIKNLSDVKPAIDRVEEYHAIMKYGLDADSKVVMTTNYELAGYYQANRFEKILFLRTEVEKLINEIVELPVGDELSRIYKEQAIANLTLGKALLGEHYQELLQIQKSGNAVEVID